MVYREQSPKNGVQMLRMQLLMLTATRLLVPRPLVHGIRRRPYTQFIGSRNCRSVAIFWEG
jgi:hypothetical protein